MDEIPVAVVLIKEWSVWLVGIQTAAIGLISAFYNKGGFQPFKNKWLSYTIILFTLSILASSWTLAALPDIVSRVTEGEVKIHDLPAFHLVPIPLWVLTSAQHWFFMLGLGTFVYSAIKSIK